MSLVDERINDALVPGGTTIAADPYPWPFDGNWGPHNTALIVIDMQVDFCAGLFLLLCFQRSDQGVYRFLSDLFLFKHSVFRHRKIICQFDVEHRVIILLNFIDILKQFFRLYS